MVIAPICCASQLNGLCGAFNYIIHIAAVSGKFFRIVVIIYSKHRIEFILMRFLGNFERKDEEFAQNCSGITQG